MTRDRSFTLGELVLIVSVTVLLGALLMPCLEQLRSKAGAAVCTGRKQLAVAAQASYANENGGFFVIEQTPPKGDLNAHSWVAMLCNGQYENTGRYTVAGAGKYLKFSDAQCPDATPYLPQTSNYHVQVFGMDATMGNPRPLLGTWFVQKPGFRGMDTKGMKKANEIPVFADTVRVDGNYNGTGTPFWIFTLYGGLAQNREIKAPLGGVREAHEGRISVGYADGHAELVSGQEMYDSPYRLRTWLAGTSADTMVLK